VSAITIGVRDIARAKQFYAGGLGWPIEADHGQFVMFGPGTGSSRLSLFTWDALAGDAGVPPTGRAFAA
jgi:catechol 2,3-dioxygenase-like lactoylglutathione lyase family enzyme